MLKINNANNISIYRKPMSHKEVNFKGYEKLYEMAERIPEYGTFSTKKITLHNKNYDVKDIVLSVKPSILLKERPKERELKIAVKSYNRQHEYSIVLARGENDEILKVLQDDSLPLRIDDFIQEAVDKFRDYD